MPRIVSAIIACSDITPRAFMPTSAPSFRVLTLFGLLALGSSAVQLDAAQSEYPTKPVHILVPFPPGGPADGLARIVGDKLSQSLGQSFVIDNKPGAGGNIGMEQGAKAPPDGYTLTLAAAGNLTIAPSLYSKLPYDPVKDYVPISVLANVPNILITAPTVPARTLRDLITLAKARPGTLNFASPGNGSGAHLAGELFKSMAGVDIVHVPFNGVGPAMNAILVMRIGRSRNRHASIAPSNGDRCASSCLCFANSTMRIAFLAARPISMMLPIWT